MKLAKRLEYMSDNVIQILPEGPLFSKLEINPSELCNRDCSFCPRGEGYPNRNVHISDEVIRKIVIDLEEVGFEGLVEICGNGEPLLSKSLMKLVTSLNKYDIALTTNGDRLTTDKINQLVASGVNYFVLSLYDGEEQLEEFITKFHECGVDKDNYDLREYWHPELNFANRAGALSAMQKSDNRNKPCYYLHYSMFVGVHGEIEFCCHTTYLDDHYHGNMMDSSLKEIWYGDRMNKYRDLLESGRNHEPCSNCTIGGTRYGKQFVEKRVRFKKAINAF